MINTIKQLFGLGPKVDYAELVKQGAIILDVRSKGEYAGGHIKGSVNISVDTLSNNLSKLKDKKKQKHTEAYEMQKMIDKMKNDPAWFTNPTGTAKRPGR